MGPEFSCLCSLGALANVPPPCASPVVGGSLPTSRLAVGCWVQREQVPDLWWG